MNLRTPFSRWWRGWEWIDHSALGTHRAGAHISQEPQYCIRFRDCANALTPCHPNGDQMKPDKVEIGGCDLLCPFLELTCGLLRYDGTPRMCTGGLKLYSDILGHSFAHLENGPTI